MEEEDHPAPGGVPGGDVPQEEVLSGTATLEPAESFEVRSCSSLLPWTLTSAGALLTSESLSEAVLACDPVAPVMLLLPSDPAHASAREKERLGSNSLKNNELHG